MKHLLFYGLFVSILLCFFNCKSQINLDSGLIGYYPFSGNALDYSSYGNHGINNGAVLSPDRFGIRNRAFRFNGVNSYLSISNGLNPQKISITMWFKTNFPASGLSARMIRNRMSGYEMDISIMKKLIYQFYIGSSNTISYTTNFPVNDSLWHFAALTFDGKIARYYFDGIKLDSTSTPPSNIYYSGNYLAFGRDGDSPTDYYYGYLDDIRIYNRGLSISEVLAIYYENQCLISVEDTMHIKINLVGINPPVNKNILKIYPNPTQDNVIIDAGNYLQMNGYGIRIVNSISQVIWQSPINKQMFSISGGIFKTTGIFYIQIINPNSAIVETRKLIIQ